jgi:surface polysaccharide O-acyltransferase-like enzyme
MVEFRTMLLFTDAFLFIIVGIVLFIRVKEAKGALLRAKVSVIMAALSAAATFIVEVAMALSYDPFSLNQNLVVKQLYIFEDLFAMLVLAFLGSFAVFATYAGSKRKWIVLLIFIIALLPPSYLTFAHSQAIVSPVSPPQPELFDFTSPPLTKIFYAICGIPLGLAPLVVFARSLMMARKRKDKVLSSRSAIMFSAVAFNEAVYLIYVFAPIIDVVALVAWIPAALFLLFAVLRITSPVQHTEEK